MTVDENSLEITIAPAKKLGSNANVSFDRKAGIVHLINDITTGESDATTTIGINRGLSDNEVHVWGNFPVGGHSFSAFISVNNPALWAAKLFKDALVARGIQVDGDPHSRDARVAASEKFDPQQRFQIASVESEALSAIVRHTNKTSDNLYAELILRTIGKERGSLANDPDARKNRGRGDDEAGVAVIKWWLNTHGIPANALAINDGSGLSRLDLVTPETTGRLLTAMANSPSNPVFHDSLPIAGRDGTLQGRLSAEAGRIFAKTGSLTYDHSLSGYLTTPAGEVLSFSIFCNDATAESRPVRTIDAIVGLLAGNEPHQPRKSAQK